MRKQYGMFLLAAVLLLCAACGKEPVNQPPADSRMQASSFAIADGKVTEKVLNCVSADYKNDYTYTLSNGVESRKEGSGGVSSAVTFAQLQKALDTLAAYTAEPGLPFAGPYSRGTFQPDKNWYVVGDAEPQENQCFFVYSVSQNQLVPLEGAYTGGRTLGVLSFSNLNDLGIPMDGSSQGKWCYVFLDQ